MLGTLAGSHGYYEFDGGIIKAGSITVGQSGTGNFLQKDGTQNTVSGNLSVGASSSYTMNGGTLMVGGNETLVGNAAWFIQNLGSHTVSGTVTVGDGTSSTPEFHLNGGSFTANNVTINNGTFIQDHDSTSTIAGTLSVSSGTPYDLKSGTLTSSIANLTGAGLKLDVEAPATAHLIVLQGDGTMQVDAGGKALFDTPGGLNEIDPTVNNSGTLALVAGSDISVGSSAVINNNAGGLFDLQTDAGLAGHGGTTTAAARSRSRAGAEPAR